MMPQRRHPVWAVCSTERKLDMLRITLATSQSCMPVLMEAALECLQVCFEHTCTVCTMGCGLGAGGITTSSPAGAALGSPHTGGGMAAQRAASGDNAATAADAMAALSAAPAAVDACSKSLLSCISVNTSDNNGTSAAEVVRDTCLDNAFPPVLAACGQHDTAECEHRVIRD